MNTLKKGAVLAAAFAATLSFAGCGTGKSVDDPAAAPQAITIEALEGTWNLTGAFGADGEVKDRPEGTLTVEPGGRFAFDAQCNQMGGDFKVEEGTLSSEGTVMTLMLCEGPAGEVDGIASAVFSMIEGATLTESGELMLDGPDEQALKFQKN